MSFSVCARIKEKCVCEELLDLDIGKETATVDRFAKMISFCIYLYGKVKSEILVTSDVHDDICLVKAGEILWSEALCFDYKSLVMGQS